MKTIEEVAKAYEEYDESAQKEILKDLEGAEILYHEYSDGGYDGSVITIYEKDGKYYHADGGHCSCYGLEGQWNPLEMPLQGIIQIVENHYHFDEVERKELLKLLKEKVA